MIANDEINQSVGGEASVLPWEIRPYQLTSWWDMEKFSAETFVTISSVLAGRSAQLFARKAVQTFDDASQKALASDLRHVAQQCKSIGLKVVGRQFSDAAEMVLNTQLNTTQVSQLLVDLGSAITSEMSENLFLRVFPERVEYYRDPELFGSNVASAFPSAARDISEAGSCYASDRNTASVMHLMRVLEVGLSVLAARLGVQSDRRNWENIINDIESEIKKVNGAHAGADWKVQQQFYSGAAKDFRYFKDAWRNHAMHYREHYEPSEARTIMDHVKVFMIQLANGGLKE
jgi:hypothetical protein